jgi:hypothetical protein
MLTAFRAAAAAAQCITCVSAVCLLLSTAAYCCFLLLRLLELSKQKVANSLEPLNNSPVISISSSSRNAFLTLATCNLYFMYM